LINCLYFRAQWRERERLESAEAMRVRRHLANCQRCLAYDRQMRTAGHKFKDLSVKDRH
jgi:hypothetical protein